MLCLLHVAEGIGDARRREGGHHQRLNFARFEHIADFRQQLAEEGRVVEAEVGEVEAGHLHVAAQRLHADGSVGVDIALADFDETSERGQNIEALLDVGGRQRVQNDIDAASIGEAHDLVCEVEVARAHHMLDTKAAQIGTLFLIAGSSEDFSAGALGKLDGSKANTAGRDVDQDALTLLETRDMIEAVVDGRERGWDGRRAFERDVLGNFRQRSGRQLDEALQAAAIVAHDAITNFDVGDTGANGGNDGAIFQTEVTVSGVGLGFSRQQPGDGHDVAEVEADGLDL